MPDGSPGWGALVTESNPRYEEIGQEIDKIENLIKYYASSPISSEEQVGGIDLNEIAVDRQGGGVSIEFDPIQMQQMLNLNIDGVAPVIISITPLPSILPLLGLSPQREEDDEGFELSALN